MADADEDVIPRTGPPAEETDLSDEVQDFRFLTFASKDDAKIPKRGEKDFEPHKTDLQAGILDASRQAMHDALSFQRVHMARKANLAVYHPETNMAYVDAPKSVLFKSIGGTVYGPKTDPLRHAKPNPNRLWLLPEEVLYLIERGTVDVRWPALPSDGDELGLPMSVQGAHAVFIGLADEHKDGLTLERFSVYSYLKRAGYHVHRAPTWSTSEVALADENFPPLPPSWSRLGLSKQWLAKWFEATPLTASGPIASRRSYRSYSDIYRALAIIPWHDPSTRKMADAGPPREQDLRVTYHVWKPNNLEYKKSRPGPPDFRIAVVDARQTFAPTLADLAGLMDTYPYAPPPDSVRHFASRLKHGHKAVILAVVDQGVSSFMRLSDMVSGLLPLHERVFRPGGGKRGGKPFRRKK